jgi:hypothetical protein
MHSRKEALVGMTLTFAVFILILVLSYMAPCGCYAGTPIKDVPLRCIQERPR